MVSRNLSRLYRRWGSVDGARKELKEAEKLYERANQLDAVRDVSRELKEIGET